LAVQETEIVSTRATRRLSLPLSLCGHIETANG
jgi:hypothetical protein